MPPTPAKQHLSRHVAPLANGSTAHAVTRHGALPPESNGRSFRTGHHLNPGGEPSPGRPARGAVVPGGHGHRIADDRLGGQEVAA